MHLVSLRALAPSLTRITVAGAVGVAMHIGQRNCDLVDAHAIEFSRGVLAQTDIEGEVICCEGPKGNVLKLRPPMPFRPEHVDIVVDALTDSLSAVHP